MIRVYSVQKQDIGGWTHWGLLTVFIWLHDRGAAWYPTPNRALSVLQSTPRPHPHGYFTVHRSDT